MWSFRADIQSFQKLINSKLSLKSDDLSKEHDCSPFVNAFDAMFFQLSSEALPRRSILLGLIALHQTFDQLDRCRKEGKDHADHRSILDPIQYSICLLISYRPVQLINGKHQRKASSSNDERIVHSCV